jgi:thiol-disulfide isomerase/thioredoxin
VCFKYNDNGVVKDGCSFIKLNPFDKYHTDDYYKSSDEKDCDFVVQNNQYREGIFINGKDSLIFEVTNIFPYPDFVNLNFINVNLKRIPQIQNIHSIIETAVYKISDTINFNNKTFVIDRINYDGLSLYLKELSTYVPVEGFNVGEIINDLKFIDTLGIRKKENIYLLDFWGLWCKPCIELIPELKRLNDILDDRLQIISIATDNKLNRKTYDNFIEKNGMKWNHIFLNNGFKSSLVKKLKITNYPTTILISDSGEIIFRSNNAKFQDLNKILKNIN